MQTLSITKAHQLLREAVSEFEGVRSYKVEFGMWDESSSPYVELYVTGSLHGQPYYKYTESQSFFQALHELKDWYKEISRTELVIEHQA